MTTMKYELEKTGEETFLIYFKLRFINFLELTKKIARKFVLVCPRSGFEPSKLALWQPAQFDYSCMKMIMDELITC